MPGQRRPPRPPCAARRARARPTPTAARLKCARTPSFSVQEALFVALWCNNCTRSRRERPFAPRRAAGATERQKDPQVSPFSAPVPAKAMAGPRRSAIEDAAATVRAVPMTGAIATRIPWASAGLRPLEAAAPVFKARRAYRGQRGYPGHHDVPVGQVALSECGRRHGDERAGDGSIGHGRIRHGCSCPVAGVRLSVWHAARPLVPLRLLASQE